MKNIFDKIREVTSERTGVEKKDIMPESYFMEDLNVDEMELEEIITELEEDLEIDLEVDLNEIKTVSDLLHAITDVTE